MLPTVLVIIFFFFRDRFRNSQSITISLEANNFAAFTKSDGNGTTETECEARKTNYNEIRVNSGLS